MSYITRDTQNYKEFKALLKHRLKIDTCAKNRGVRCFLQQSSNGIQDFVLYSFVSKKKTSMDPWDQCGSSLKTCAVATSETNESQSSREIPVAWFSVWHRIGN